MSLIFVPGQVPPKKTSQEVQKPRIKGMYKCKVCGKMAYPKAQSCNACGMYTGRLFYKIQPSSRCRNYIKEFESVDKTGFVKSLEGIEKPYVIGFHFIRQNRKTFDQTGPLETIQDVMSDCEWYEDDNVKIMYPAPLMINGRLHSVDKEKAGVIIKVFKSFKYVTTNHNISFLY